MTARKIQLSVVIPVYRSAAILPTLADRLLKVLDGMGMTYEILFVDDCGPDNSWEVLCRLHQLHPDHIRAIQLMRNFGQHNAIMCGLRHARGEVIVTMDDDLQQLPEDIPRLVAALQGGEHDLVYGVYADRQHSSWRNLGSLIVTSFYKWVFKIPITISSFRAMRRHLVRSIFYYSLNFTIVDGLLAWSTQRIGQVPVEHQPRANGRSGYSITRLIMHAINLFTNFSLLPLQLVSMCGIVAATGGFLLALYYLVMSLLSNITWPGYASTIIAVLILGGIQLLSLGIMGEYIGRLHLNVNRKPQYVVRKMLKKRSARARQPERDGQPVHTESSSPAAG